MVFSHATSAPCQWFTRLASALDSRSAPRLALLFLGAVLARGRRTVTSWTRAAGLGDRFRSCYIAVAAAGKKADSIASRVLTEVVRPLVSGASRLRDAARSTQPAACPRLGTLAGLLFCAHPTRRFTVRDPASIAERSHIGHSATRFAHEVRCIPRRSAQADATGQKSGSR